MGFCVDGSGHIGGESRNESFVINDNEGNSIELLWSDLGDLETVLNQLKEHQGVKTEPPDIRPEIMDIAKVMESVMRKHDGSKGESWKDMNYFLLRDLLDKEIREMRDAAEEPEEREMEEILDVMVTAMMLWFRLRLMKENEVQDDR